MLLFFSFFIVFIFPYLGIKKQKRNWKILAIVFLLSFTCLFSHIGHHFQNKFFVMTGLHIGLNLILVLIVVISGRVIPMFTKNAIEGSKAQSFAWLDKAALFSIVILIVVSGMGPKSMPFTIVALGAGLINFLRLVMWRPDQTLKKPIVWTLHASYFWFCLGLILLGLKKWFDIPTGTVLHLLTLGTIATFIYSMVTRVSLGHTGRPIVAHPLIALSYYLLNLSVLIRVFLPMYSMDYYLASIMGSGLLWMVISLIFIIIYAPILTKPRV